MSESQLNVYNFYSLGMFASIVEEHNNETTEFPKIEVQTLPVPKAHQVKVTKVCHPNAGFGQSQKKTADVKTPAGPVSEPRSP